MIIGNKGVKYGLTVPQAKQKAKVPAVKPLNVFGEDEDSGGEAQAVEREIVRQGAKKLADSKVAQMQQQALAEDATVFDYDGVYDSIQAERVQPKQAEKLARKSRYIEGLMRKAEERKKEEDIVYERRLAKEREAEDHLFGDKERFVTAAYKRKLQEDKLWLERDRLIQEQEEANDVVKKGHMGDFFRNIMTRNVDFHGEKGGQKPGGAPDAGTPGAGPSGTAGDPAWEAARAMRQQYEEAQEAPAAEAAEAAAPGEPDRPVPNQPGSLPREPAAPSEAPSGTTPRVPGAGLLADSKNPLLVRQAQLREAAKRKVEEGAAGSAEGTAPGDQQGEAGPAGPAEPVLSKEDRAAAARERYLARKRKAVSDPP